MRIFKNTWFDRFAVKECITDCELKELVNRLEAGQGSTDLGGNVYKIRMARLNEGKSGGYRIIVFYRSEDRTFFVYGFAKSDKANISKKELKMYKEAAKEYFTMTPEQLNERINHNQLIEL